MLEGNGDQLAGRAGWIALALFPTAEGTQADAEKAGEGFLGQVEGLADLGDFALGLLRFGRVAALGLWIDGNAGDGAIGPPFQTEHARGGSLAPFHGFFTCFECGDIRDAAGGGASGLGFGGGGGDGFHGILRLSCCNLAALKFSASFLA